MIYKNIVRFPRENDMGRPMYVFLQKNASNSFSTVSWFMDDHEAIQSLSTLFEKQKIHISDIFRGKQLF